MSLFHFIFISQRKKKKSRRRNPTSAAVGFHLRPLIFGGMAAHPTRPRSATGRMTGDRERIFFFFFFFFFFFPIHGRNNIAARVAAKIEIHHHPHPRWLPVAPCLSFHRLFHRNMYVSKKKNRASTGLQLLEMPSVSMPLLPETAIPAGPGSARSRRASLRDLVRVHRETLRATSIANRLSAISEDNIADADSSATGGDADDGDGSRRGSGPVAAVASRPGRSNSGMSAVGRQGLVRDLEGNIASGRPRTGSQHSTGQYHHSRGASSSSAMSGLGGGGGSASGTVGSRRLSKRFSAGGGSGGSDGSASGRRHVHRASHHGDLLDVARAAQSRVS